jgi:hypothetical protein
MSRLTRRHNDESRSAFSRSIPAQALDQRRRSRLLYLTRCHQQISASTSQEADSVSESDYNPSHPAGTRGLNYTAYGIASFSITDTEGRSGGGPNINPSDGNGKPVGGGAESCCVMVPKKWRKGMEVTVSWERDTHPYDHEDRTGDQWLKAVAKVPPYDGETQGFWVYFLEGDRIKVEVGDGIDHGKPRFDDPYVAQGVLDNQLNKEAQR